MHLIKDENGNLVQHGHGHTHEHTHEDGVTHTHEHTHGDGHDHGHTHTDHACENSHCGSCNEGDCKNETLALLTYMLQHNEHHAQELDQMADNLAKMGMDAACKTIKEAVADFQKGNMRLGLALTLVKASPSLILPFWKSATASLIVLHAASIPILARLSAI